MECASLTTGIRTEVPASGSDIPIPIPISQLYTNLLYFLLEAIELRRVYNKSSEMLACTKIGVPLCKHHKCTIIIPLYNNEVRAGKKNNQLCPYYVCQIMHMICLRWLQTGYLVVRTDAVSFAHQEWYSDAAS